MYPTPTLSSFQGYIALDDGGVLDIDALLDEEGWRLAWEEHGFRTGV